MLGASATSILIARNPEKTFYLGLPSGENFGWGICGHYLKAELSKHVTTISLDDEPELAQRMDLPGHVLHALCDHDFNTLYAARGEKNCGYTFFEYELTSPALGKAKHFDLVFCGSSWCREKLRSSGIDHAAVLIQGIDPEHFYPMGPRPIDGPFVIFSGGKFELRKGQDLVLKAVAHLQQKYRDVLLVNAWFNLWPQTMQSMTTSPFIRFELKGTHWKEWMEHLYMLNGLDPRRIVTCERISHSELRRIFAMTDLGVFPNRCEGGTNLMLMEYMACGRPVIASLTSGHRDILNERNCLTLTNLRPFHLRDPDGQLVALWEEPSLDELIERMEHAYHHRQDLYILARRAAADMRGFTWAMTARRLLDAVLD